MSRISVGRCVDSRNVGLRFPQFVEISHQPNYYTYCKRLSYLMASLLNCLTLIQIDSHDLHLCNKTKVPAAEEVPNTEDQ
ncbi:hypothetical protein D3C74_320320 [compost metagenome]